MWLTTEHPAIVFEDTEVGRLKKIWDAPEAELRSNPRRVWGPSPSGVEETKILHPNDGPGQGCGKPQEKRHCPHPRWACGGPRAPYRV